jgi:hypothetical protein
MMIEKVATFTGAAEPMATHKGQWSASPAVA